MSRKITIQLSWISALMVISFSILAQNKVVVIPIFGDDVNQCEAKTKCEMGEMTLACPSGDTVIQCDFSDTGVVTSYSATDGLDVALPQSPWPYNFSGWDIDGIEFTYSNDSDTLSVNIDYFGIAGDADGDGDPGETSTALQNNGGIDSTNLGGSEHIYVLFDLNVDGAFDLVVGVPQQEGIQPSQNLRFANYTGNGNSVGVGDFGTLAINGVAHLNELPSAANPDFNFTISNWSNIAIDNTTSLLVDPNSFDFQVYSGSFQDDGIGEDSFTGSAGLVP